METFKLLAEAMGFEEDAFKDREEDMIRQALDFTANPYLEGIKLEGLKQQRFMKLNMEPKRQFLQRLTTPSGKIELYSARMEETGLPPLPTYTPLQEGYDGERRPGAGDVYPLMFISPPNHNFLNSSFGNAGKHIELEKQPLLQIHPQDAEQRGIADGDEVIVWNDRGRYEVKASVTDKMLPGTVVSQGLWWEQDGKPRRANALTSDRLADMGGGAVFFSTVVEVQRQP